MNTTEFNGWKNWYTWWFMHSFDGDTLEELENFKEYLEEEIESIENPFFKEWIDLSEIDFEYIYTLYD